jgi:hypothetical protein
VQPDHRDYKAWLAQPEQQVQQVQLVHKAWLVHKVQQVMMVTMEQ